jgi:hypothetical protein
MLKQQTCVSLQYFISKIDAGLSLRAGYGVAGNQASTRDGPRPLIRGLAAELRIFCCDKSVFNASSREGNKSLFVLAHVERITFSGLG